MSEKTEQGWETVLKWKAGVPAGMVTECNSLCFIWCIESESVVECVLKCSAVTLLGAWPLLKHYKHFVYIFWWPFNEMEHFYFLYSPLPNKVCCLSSGRTKMKDIVKHDSNFLQSYWLSSEIPTFLIVSVLFRCYFYGAIWKIDIYALYPLFKDFHFGGNFSNFLKALKAATEQCSRFRSLKGLKEP